MPNRTPSRPPVCRVEPDLCGDPVRKWRRPAERLPVHRAIGRIGERVAPAGRRRSRVEPRLEAGGIQGGVDQLARRWIKETDLGRRSQPVQRRARWISFCKRSAFGRKRDIQRHGSQGERRCAMDSRQQREVEVPRRATGKRDRVGHVTALAGVLRHKPQVRAIEPVRREQYLLLEGGSWPLHVFRDRRDRGCRAIRTGSRTAGPRVRPDIRDPHVDRNPVAGPVCPRDDPDAEAERSLVRVPIRRHP